MSISAVIAGFSFLVAVLVNTALSITTISLENTTIGDGCPSELNWKPHNRSCYLHLAESFNFTQAERSCAVLGSNLVSIGSEEENQFILHFVGAINMPVWIGLYRTTSDSCNGDSCGNWMWLDRSELGFSHWAPDLLESTGQCVFMDSQGDWDHSRACSKERSYVCKQKWIFPEIIIESTTEIEPCDMTETRFSNPVDDAALTESSTKKNNDQLSTYIGVGVTLGILVVVIISGLGVYSVNCRRGKQTEIQASGVRSLGTGDYENFGQEAVGQQPVYANSVILNNLSGNDVDIHANQRRVDISDNPTYEQVNYYLEGNTDYTDLQPVESTQTSAVSQEDNYEVYLNTAQN